MGETQELQVISGKCVNCYNYYVVSFVLPFLVPFAVINKVKEELYDFSTDNGISLCLL